MSAETRYWRLHLHIVKRPSSAVSIHITFKHGLWKHSKTIKVFSMILFVDVYIYIYICYRQCVKSGNVLHCLKRSGNVVHCLTPPGNVIHCLKSSGIVLQCLKSRLVFYTLCLKSLSKCFSWVDVLYGQWQRQLCCYEIIYEIIFELLVAGHL